MKVDVESPYGKDLKQLRRAPSILDKVHVNI